MKRTFIFLLTAVMLLCLAACNQTEVPPAETDGPTSAPTQATQGAKETTPAPEEEETQPIETTQPVESQPSETQPVETTPPASEDKHTHSWVDATCTTAKTCSVCKATEGAANGHSWKDATCTTAKTCSVCKATEGAANGHSWKDATCTEPKTCSACNLTEGAANGHSWKDATCTAPKTCSICKATEGNAAGHKAGDWIVELEATCTTDGSRHKVCSVCNEKVETEAIKAGHKPGEWITDTEATCTEAGSKHQVCAVCAATMVTEEIPAIGHNYNQTLIEASGSSGASLKYDCKKCGHSYSEEIPAIGGISHVMTGMSSVSGPFGSYQSKSFTIYASGGYGTLQYKFMSGSSIVRDYSTSNSITVTGSGLLTVIVKDEAGQTATYSFYI